MRLIYRVCGLVRRYPQFMYRHSSSSAPVNLAFDLEDPSGSNKGSVIVMHGLLGSKRNWKSFCKNLAPEIGMKVYNVDARNHGDSPHTTDHSISLMAEDVAHFIRQNSLGKVSTIGHSMGGRAMMYLSLLYPDLVERTIIADISPFSLPRDVKGMTNIFKAMKEVDMIPPDTSLTKGRAIMHKKLLDQMEGRRKSTIDFIMMNLRKRPTGEFYWAANVDALLQSMNDYDSFAGLVNNLPPFLGEVLFICGSSSPFFDQSEWPSIIKIFPNARLEWVDAGHLVHIEKPQEFKRLASAFLSK